MLVLVLALAVFGVAQARADLVEPCGNATSHAPVDLVSKINDDGLGIFRTMSPSGQLRDMAVSPLAAWHLRYLVGNGGDRVVPPSERAAAQAMIDATLQTRGQSLAGALWFDGREARGFAANRGTIASSTCALVVTRDWEVPSGFAFASPVDDLISDWLDAHGSLSELFGRPLTTSHDRRNAAGFGGPGRSLDVATALQIGAELDTKPSRAWPALEATPYFEDHGVSGIRLDANVGRTAFYLFTGPETALSRIQRTLDSKAWRAIRGAFKTRLTLVDSTLDISTDAWFYPGADYAYGSELTLQPGGDSAYQNIRLKVGPSGLSLIVLGSVVGQLPHGPVSVDLLRNFPTAPAVSSRQSMLYLVEDETTGAILLVGAHYASPCSYAFAACPG